MDRGNAGLPCGFELVAMALLLVAFAAPLTGAEIAGSVRVSEPAAADLDPAAGTFIIFRSDSKAEVPDPPVTVDVRMVRKKFEPRVVAVPVGSTVRFPNQDPILHNVFSVSPGNSFDLGLYRRGEGAEATFESSGLVRVFCNVHHSMVAYILVLDTPHATRVEADGRFRLSGLPPGPGELTVWSDRSQPEVVRVVAGETGPLAIELTADRAAVPRHANKLGKPYPRPSRTRAY